MNSGQGGAVGGRDFHGDSAEIAAAAGDRNPGEDGPLIGDIGGGAEIQAAGGKIIVDDSGGGEGCGNRGSTRESCAAGGVGQHHGEGFVELDVVVVREPDLNLLIGDTGAKAQSAGLGRVILAGQGGAVAGKIIDGDRAIVAIGADDSEDDVSGILVCGIEGRAKGKDAAIDVVIDDGNWSKGLAASATQRYDFAA